MITAQLSRPNLQYDMNALLKSFYPPEDIEMADAPCENGIFVARILKDGEEIINLEMPDTMDEDKSGFKNELRRRVYRELKRITGKELPWGILNGIRPTKLVREKLMSGASHEEASFYMKDVYLASDEKSELAVDIAEREIKILSKLHTDNGYSLYIGIPFCPTTCLYCSFTSYPIGMWKKRVQEYLEALFKEIDFTAELMKDKVLDTIYIGGGTPTTLEPEEFRQLFERIYAKFDTSNLIEFTVESGRADSITEEKLKVMKEYGVTRISVNPQTMNDKTLKLIGRQHNVEQVKGAFAMARRVGFDNINMDLILGLPGEMDEEVSFTMSEIEKLAPDNLTVHSLAIKRASKLNRVIDEMGYKVLHNTDSTMAIASKCASDMGMKPYYLYRQKNMTGNFENTGYAKPGKEGIYNILINEEVQTIVALGAGTVTKRVFPDKSIMRCDTAKDVGLYIEQIDEMIERKRELFAL
ncbi:MAG: coproporphyrinogen dehydrogenase HemZ [Lachnospiraceae bacterium]|nr:coproporphyrinogen dehydrogenase HemZ [Lachnospiraceae bacterium]